MKYFQKKDKRTALEKRIDENIESLKEHKPESLEYKAIAANLSTLMELKKLDNTKTRDKISPNTIISAAASLGGIALVLFWEHAHVVTSKALGFVFKPKI